MWLQVARPWGWHYFYPTFKKQFHTNQVNSQGYFIKGWENVRARMLTEVWNESKKSLEAFTRNEWYLINSLKSQQTGSFARQNLIRVEERRVLLVKHTFLRIINSTVLALGLVLADYQSNIRQSECWMSGGWQVLDTWVLPGWIRSLVYVQIHISEHGIGKFKSLSSQAWSQELNQFLMPQSS